MNARKYTHETVDGRKFQTLEAAIQHAAGKLLGSLPEYIYSCSSKEPVYVLYPDHTQKSLRR